MKINSLQVSKNETILFAKGTDNKKPAQGGLFVKGGF